jgi:Tfp pilus assembly protein PilX
MLKFYKSSQGSEQQGLSCEIMSVYSQALVSNQYAASLYYCTVALYHKYTISEVSLQTYFEITAEVVINRVFGTTEIAKT